MRYSFQYMDGRVARSKWLRSQSFENYTEYRFVASLDSSFYKSNTSTIHDVGYNPVNREHPMFNRVKVTFKI